MNNNLFWVCAGCLLVMLALKVANAHDERYPVPSYGYESGYSYSIGDVSPLDMQLLLMEMEMQREHENYIRDDAMDRKLRRIERELRAIGED